MAKSDYIKMLECGEWLEIFLDDQIKAWQCKDLVKQAIKLLNVQFNLDFLRDHFEKISSLEENTKEMEESRTFERWGKIILPLLERIDKNVTGPYGEIIIPDELIETTYPLVIPAYREYLNELLRQILSRNIPWDYMFMDVDVDANNKVKETSNSFEPIPFIDGYAHISKILTIVDTADENDLGGRLTEIFSFNIPYRFSPYMFDSRYHNSEHSGQFVWHAILAHIFFQFFNLGGQDYFGFCERCDKFFLIKRKGRKKYCSDICRALASRERSSQ